MVSFSRPVKSNLFVVFLLSTMCVSFQVTASDDAYLKMLEGEAEDLRLDQSGQLKGREEAIDIQSSKESLSKTNWTWEGDLEGDILPSGLAQNEFSALLEQNFYGTYVFYRKLSSIDRQTVHYHYSKKQKAELDSIRQEILDLLKK